MPRAAIVYDFDGTLARGNIQEHSFLPELGLDVGEFWREVKRLAKAHDADEILIYMWRMLEAARSRGDTVTRSALQRHGARTPLFDGLDTWFERISRHASEQDLQLDHYVISSGTDEIIRGCSIYDKFRAVYASRYIYNDNDEAVWPGLAVNYTAKTQFLFRINKGVENSWDNEAVNMWIPLNERPVPFKRMIILGDGDTDIPAMKMVRHQAGHAIAVYDPHRWSEPSSQKKLYKLIAEDRADFVAPADYREGSQLDVTVKGILGRYARDAGYRGDG